MFPNDSIMAQLSIIRNTNMNEPTPSFLKWSRISRRDLRAADPARTLGDHLELFRPFSSRSVCPLAVVRSDWQWGTLMVKACQLSIAYVIHQTSGHSYYHFQLLTSHNCPATSWTWSMMVSCRYDREQLLYFLVGTAHGNVPYFLE